MENYEAPFRILANAIHQIYKEKVEEFQSLMWSSKCNTSILFLFEHKNIQMFNQQTDMQVEVRFLLSCNQLVPVNLTTLKINLASVISTSAELHFYMTFLWYLRDPIV